MNIFRIYGVEPHTKKLTASLAKEANIKLEGKFHTIKLLNYKQLGALQVTPLAMCGGLAKIIPKLPHLYRIDILTNTIEPLYDTRYTSFIYKYAEMPSYFKDELLLRRILKAMC
jgi:hypothetical protein